ncbi:MAG: DUF1501 domain-containing protein [Gemmataceae bacterium]|nr:DUF1501 domain-containing protein [Gemmataceae bacterium]
MLLDRRDLLRFGSVGLAATALPGLRANTPKKAKSVLVLWMAGGVTHHESFDPKPDAPEEIRGSLGTIATGLPGVRFCETMPGLAEQTDLFALVRTFSPATDDHLLAQSYGLSGRKTTQAQILTEPNIGAIHSKLKGGRAGFPGYIAVPGTTRPGPPPYQLFTGGWLGAQYAPFATGGKPKNDDFTAFVKEADEEQFTKQGVTPFADLTEDRLDNRELLRSRLDDALRQADTAGVGDQYRDAFQMLTSPTVRAAFELSRESDKTREAYGKTKVGARCLLARRLVEAGAPFVLVDYGYDPEYGNLWDNHNAAGQNFPHICEMAKRPYHVAGMDRAFAALLGDLKTRGLLESTFVLFLTDFGRTPKINKAGGRDHWGPAGSIFFAGGGVKGGQVIGGTDKSGAYPTGVSYSPGDVAATLYAAVGIDQETTLYNRQNQPLAMLPAGAPIPGVLG